MKDYLEILRSSPDELKKISSSVPTKFKSIRPEKNKWSLKEILNHIRGYDRVWSTMIFRMVYDDNPTLEFIHPNRISQIYRWDEMTFSESLKVFKIERTHFVKQIEQMGKIDLQKVGLVKNRKHTVLRELVKMARHELKHQKQMARHVHLLLDSK